MEKLKIEYVALKSIKPYEKNAKKHPEQQLEQIKNSIKQFGYLDPIGVWKNEIVEGHGRYEAAKQLGMKQVPIIRLDTLTDEQRKAYMLAHNQLTMNTGWDYAMLDMELAQIKAIDMTLLGFESTDDEEFDFSEFEKDEKKQQKKKTVVCPHCGESFEI